MSRCAARHPLIFLQKTGLRSMGLALILIPFVVLAGYYNISIPVYESPDELEHVAFVIWLADHGTLPVVDPENPGPWSQEGAQPPLYYWIAAQLAGPLPHSRADALATLNPHASLGNPRRLGNKNIFLHDPEQERWPYQGQVLFVRVLRAISTLMAIGTLGAIYRLGRILVPERPEFALATTGWVAFLPQFIFLSASVNNDNLIILIASWVLVLLVSWVRAPRRPNWFQLSVLGVMLGLGALAKTSGLLLWLLAAIALTWLGWQARRWDWWLLALLFVFFLALAVSGWWFVRNQRLYGEMTGIGAHLSIVGQRRHLPRRWPALLSEFRGFRYSFWLLFGWFNVLAPELFYRVMDGFTVVGLIGLGIFLAQSLRRQPQGVQVAILLLVAWLSLVGIGLIRWTMWTPASQGRLLFPAIACIGLALVAGWARWVPRRLHRPVGVLALATWLTWAGLCPALFLRPAYALPERVRSLDELSAALSPLTVVFGGCCELVGYGWVERKVTQKLDRPLHAGEYVRLMLAWRSLQTMDKNYSLAVHIKTVDGQVVGQTDTFHGQGMYPTSYWRPGEVIADPVYVQIPYQVQEPALIRFHVELYDLSTMEKLPIIGPDGTEMEYVSVGEAALAPAQWPQPRSNLAPATVFGQTIRLAYVNFPDTGVRPGDVITVTLQWEALGRITEDYTGFIHLVDSEGNHVAQDDHPPLRGWFPTRVWFPGTVIFDSYRLQVPEDLAAGRYELWAGLYDSESKRRLPAIQQLPDTNNAPQKGKRWKDDLVPIGTLLVNDQ